MLILQSSIHWDVRGRWPGLRLRLGLRVPGHNNPPWPATSRWVRQPTQPATRWRPRSIGLPMK